MIIELSQFKFESTKIYKNNLAGSNSYPISKLENFSIQCT